MGILDAIANTRAMRNVKQFTDATTEARQRLDEKLGQLRLGEEELSGQSQSQLLESLERINHLIDNPDDQPFVHIVFGDGEIVVSDQEVMTEDGDDIRTVRWTAGPQLLSRRDMVIKRLQELNREERQSLAKATAAGEMPDDTRAALDEQARKLAAEEQRLEQLREETASLRDQQAFEREQQAAKFQLEAEEKRAEIARMEMVAQADLRSRWWQTRLGRDSIAAIVGGVLLLSFALAVIVAMFTDTQTSDIVQNSFLLILGYFFGAATASRQTDQATS